MAPEPKLDNGHPESVGSSRGWTTLPFAQSPPGLRRSNVRIGPRIEPPNGHGALSNLNGHGGNSAVDFVDEQVNSETHNIIQYRTCSWQQTAILLFSQYIGLSILSFVVSYTYLGLVPGLLLSAVMAGFMLYTNLIAGEVCLRHPEVRDVCDVAKILFWNQNGAWWATAVMLILNNIVIQALQVGFGTHYLIIMAGLRSISVGRKVGFSAAIAAIGWLGSLPRTLNGMSRIGFIFTFFTFIAAIVRIAGGWAGEGKADWLARQGKADGWIWMPSSTKLAVGVLVFLNMSNTFIGQRAFPSFISEMRDPRDFPKALWAFTTAQIITFSAVGSVLYVCPRPSVAVFKAYLSLLAPTVIFVGCLCASISSRLVFFHTFKAPKYVTRYTDIGWFWWSFLLLVIWALSFVLAIIPFLPSSDYLSTWLYTMLPLFNCWFGFVMWAFAYFRMRHADRKVGMSRDAILDCLSVGLNFVVILAGAVYFSLGTYAAIQYLIDCKQDKTLKAYFERELYAWMERGFALDRPRVEVGGFPWR